MDNLFKFAQKFAKEVTNILAKNGLIIKETKVFKTLRQNEELVAIGIIEVGKNSYPVFYADDFYDDYKNGKPISKMAEHMANIYLQNRPMDNIEPISFELTLRIMNKSENKKLLSSIYHIPLVGDLMVVLAAKTKIGDTNGTTLVKKELLDTKCLTEGEAWRIARNNLSKEEFYIQDIADNPNISILGEFINQIPNDLIFIGSNKSEFYGANIILREDILKDFESQHGPFYILPVINHSVYIIPDNSNISPQKIHDILNNSSSDSESFLSNIILFFNNGKLSAV